MHVETVLFKTQHYRVFIKTSNGLSSLTIQRKDDTGRIIVDTEQGESGSAESIFYELIHALNDAQFNYIQELKEELDEQPDIKVILNNIEYAIGSVKSGLDDIECAKNDLENKF